MRERIAFRLAVLRILPLGGRMLAFGVALQVVSALMPVAFIVATSAVVGHVPGAVRAGLDSPEWRSLRNTLIVAGLLFVAQQVISPLQFTTQFMLAWRVDDHLRERAAAASFGPVGVAAIEESDIYDTLADLSYAERGTGFSPGSACWGTLVLLAMYLQWAVAAVLIGVVYTWWAALALAAGSLTMRIAIRTGFGMHARFEGSFYKLRRRKSYFRDLVTGPIAGKEIRIFGLRDWFRDAYRTTALAALLPVWRSRRRRIYGAYALSSPVWLVLCGIATIGAARAAAHGSMTIGELAYILQGIALVGNLGSFNDQSDYQTEWGLHSFVGLEQLEDRVAAEAKSSGTSDASGLPRESIRYEHVVFGYDAHAPVLRELDLTIEAGRSLAIVGLNGAGKTTLVKLLARLYEPQSGQILVDGRPLTDYDVRTWRRRVAAIFQDFVHYDLPVRENVGFGAVEFLHDDDKVRSALDRAGALDLVDQLPRRLETTLSRSYDDGAELSGGQWQRIAIARALMAVEGGASVLVLDEPTASLDVRAEAAFFERFLELTRGLTTILISHRFSTVRRADRIVVLEHGRVIEDGTHAELLALGGRYAELFHLQAARFQS
ncbi:MAG TPA: ABC transporter ATP-binding protein [Gaiellaceae bacterium]